MPYKIKKIIINIWFRLSKAGRTSDKGERFVVFSWDEMIKSGEFYHLYHAFRYWWANQQIRKNSIILDLGCGSGYGSWYLASQRNIVNGFDSSKKAITWAKKHFKNHTLIFDNYIVFPTDSRRYEIIVCFEVIEHDPENVLNTILDCIQNDGTVLISTANGSVNSVRQYLIDNKLTTVNPGHIKEFTSEEFKALLEKYFKKVELYGQCIKGVSDFEEWDKWRRKNNVKLSDFEMRLNDFVNCEVIVARCSKRK